MAYATYAQLSTWIGSSQTVPAEAEGDRLLARASSLIDRALIAAIYDVDSSGDPTDADVIQALADAACAQVAWWIKTGDELGDDGRWTSVSIGSARLSRGNGNGASTSSRLAPQVLDILITAGLNPRPAVNP